MKYRNVSTATVPTHKDPLITALSKDFSHPRLFLFDGNEYKWTEIWTLWTGEEGNGHSDTYLMA